MSKPLEKFAQPRDSDIRVVQEERGSTTFAFPMFRQFWVGAAVTGVGVLLLLLACILFQDELFGGNRHLSGGMVKLLSAGVFGVAIGLCIVLGTTVIKVTDLQLIRYLSLFGIRVPVGKAPIHSLVRITAEINDWQEPIIRVYGNSKRILIEGFNSAAERDWLAACLNHLCRERGFQPQSADPASDAPRHTA